MGLKASFMAAVTLSVSIFLMFACSPANAVEVSAMHGEIDLLLFLQMLWEMRNGLPWYELVALGVFASLPIASAFTSLTPTPKPGTLWAFIYGVIEKAAWQFYRSKDKAIDTEVRKLSGKPLNLESTGVQMVGNEIKGIVIDTVTQSLPGRIIKALGRLF